MAVIYYDLLATDLPPVPAIPNSHAPVTTDHFSVPAPPIPQYRLGKWKELVGWHREWSRDYGFMAVVKKSEGGYLWVNGVRQIARGTIQCSSSGSYRPHRKVDSAAPVKVTARNKTRKTMCPFAIHYSYHAATDTFRRLEGGSLEHNHAPHDLACFAQFRRLNGDMLSFAISLIDQASPGSILGSLQVRFGHSCIATYDDVRNLQQRAWAAERAGMKATEAMLLVLESVQMSSRYWLNPETGELLGVLLTDPMAIVLAQSYAEVLQMDCTYKTNKYNMPMFHVTSHTGCGNTFTVAVCFLKQETIADYTRAIQELRKLIPDLPTKSVVTDAEAALAAALKAVCPDWKHILCRWHLGQNILTEFKKRMTVQQWVLVMTQWRGIINSVTVDDLENRLDKFTVCHQSKPYGSKLVKYIRHRLRPGMRQKLVSCFIEEYAHFGQTSSSPAEGGHSQLKRQLHSVRGDLITVVKVIRAGMYAQQSSVLQKLRMEDINRPVGRSETFFGVVSFRWWCARVIAEDSLQILGKVSTKCIEQLDDTLGLAKQWLDELDRGIVKEIDPCFCRTRTKMQLPCYHYLLEHHYIEDRKTLPLSEVGKHWHLRKAQDLQDLALLGSFSASVERVEPPDYPAVSASQLRKAAKRKAADDRLAHDLATSRTRRAPRLQGQFADVSSATSRTVSLASQPAATALASPSRPRSISPPLREVRSVTVQPSLTPQSAQPVPPVTAPALTAQLNDEQQGSTPVSEPENDETAETARIRERRARIYEMMQRTLDMQRRDDRRLRGMQGLEPEVGLNG